MKKILCFSLLTFLIISCQTKTKRLSDEAYNKLSDEAKHSVENALSGISVADPELDAQLFASEPMMMNPTNMDIDAQGRVWICEGYNYRNQLNPQNPYNPKGDKIIIMEDTDGDGKADTSKVFYQGEDINSALGIAVLGNKVIVSCSPNVFLFTDENGDGKADKKEILFTGISGIQHDHGMHAFSFGPDGKLYFNFGNAGEQILDKNGKALLDDLGRPIANVGKPYRDGMVFRCDLDGTHVEVMANNFRNNYEVALDSYGGMWQSDNDDDGNKGVRINYLMEYGNYGFKDEMTGANWKVRRTNWEDSIPDRHWHQNDPGVVPDLLHTGSGSPTGMVVYEGELLPKKYRNQLIHADAGPSVVRTYPVKKNGAGFQSTLDQINNIVEGGSRDKWFRPSDVTVAPDGSLFVADWYDQGVGGHAMADSVRGRIYRIFPKGDSKYALPKNNFSTPEGCTEALKSPNLATRYLAWTKLHTWQKQAEPALLQLWKSDNSRFRARALWLLGKIKGQENKYISEAIADKDEDIRITGIRLARQSSIDIIPILTKLVDDPFPQVRREVAIALHHNKSPEAASIWTTLANEYDEKDRWYLEALGIGADLQWDSFLDKWLATVGEKWKTNQAAKDIIWRSRAKESVFKLTELIKLSTSTKESLRYFRAIDFQNNPDKNKALLPLLANGTASNDVILLVFKHLDVEQAKKSSEFKALLPKVLAAIKNPKDYFDIVQRYQLKDQRQKLLNYAISDPDNTIHEEAAKILVHNNGIGEFTRLAFGKDVKLAREATKSFGLVDEKPVTEQLIKIFSNKKLNKDLRDEAMLGMSGWDSEEILWNLIKAKKVPADEMSIAKEIVFHTWHGEIRTEAAKMFGKEPSASQQIAPIADLIKISGNVTNGQKVFDMYCTMCHQVNSKGINFGPALSEIGSKYGKDGLYNAILNPSEGISFGFENYSFKLKDGTEIQGILSSKTENEVQIKVAGSSEPRIYKRSEVIKMEQLKDSPMPKLGLKQQEIIDLVEYLSTLKKH